MKENERLMEQEIVSEENFDKGEKSEPKKSVKISPKEVLRKTRNLILNYRPKITTIGLLLGIIFILYLAFVILSLRNQDEQLPPLPPQEQKNETEEKTEDQEGNTNQKVKEYSDILDKLDNFQGKISRPIVNLDIRFNP